GHELEQTFAAFRVGGARQRGAVGVKDVEEHEVDRGASPLSFDVALPAQPHSALESAEIRSAALPEGDDLPVEDTVDIDTVGQFAKLRIGARHVTAVAAGQLDAAAAVPVTRLHPRHGTDAVPLHLEGPV